MNVLHNYLIQKYILMISATHACNILFFRSVRGHVSREITQVIEVDFTNNEVQKVMLHLSSHKSLGWDGLTNEYLKKSM